MSDEELDRLEALADAATPGVWSWERDEWMDLGDAAPSVTHTLYVGRAEGAHGLNLFGRLSLGEQGEADLDFVVAARCAVPELIEEVRQLREWLGRFASDSDQYQAGAQAALAAVTAWIRSGSRGGVAGAERAVVGACGSTESLAQLRRYRKALFDMLADTAEGGPTTPHEFREMASNALNPREGKP